MLGHALGVMNRQAFRVTMADMVSNERMKADDIRKPACQHDETVEQNNPNGIVSYWIFFQTTPLVCVRPVTRNSYTTKALGVSSNERN